MSAGSFPVGAKVRVAGSRGTFTVRRHEVAKDGSVLLWGGTPLRERFRCVPPAKLRPARRS